MTGLSSRQGPARVAVIGSVLAAVALLSGCSDLPAPPQFKQTAAPATSAPLTTPTLYEPLDQIIGGLPEQVATPEVVEALGGDSDLARAAVREPMLIWMRDALDPRLLARTSVTSSDLEFVLPLLTETGRGRLAAASPATIAGLVPYGIAGGGWKPDPTSDNPIDGLGIDAQSMTLSIEDRDGAVHAILTFTGYLYLRMTDTRSASSPEKVLTVKVNRRFDLVPSPGGLVNGRAARWLIDDWSGSQEVVLPSTPNQG